MIALYIVCYILVGLSVGRIIYVYSHHSDESELRHTDCIIASVFASVLWPFAIAAIPFIAIGWLALKFLTAPTHKEKNDS